MGPIAWTTPATLVPKGHQQFTDLDPAVQLTVPAGAQLAVLQATTAGVRYRDDGTDPTAAIGILLASSAAPYLYIGDLSALSFFETGGTAVLDVLYYAYSGQ